MKISDTNVPPTDSMASLQVAIRCLQGGNINEVEFYVLMSCLRAAQWTFSYGAQQ